MLKNTVSRQVAVLDQMGEIVELSVAQNSAIPEGLAIDAHDIVGIEIGLHAPLSQCGEDMRRPGKTGLAIAGQMLAAEV